MHADSPCTVAGAMLPQMTRTVILNVVGLTARFLGETMPNLTAHRASGGLTRVQPAFPAVTCTAQSDYLTGTRPTDHGIVGNGWYDRELAEVHFWKQSNHLVHGEKLWEGIRRKRSSFTCAKLFWWYNMHSTADYSITPRPMYPADGRKVFDIYTCPDTIRSTIKQDLGEFPFPGFWGPAAGRRSPVGGPDCATRWIAEAARWIEERHGPALSLVYLPHLDYNLQRFGVLRQDVANPALRPEIRSDLKAVDTLLGDLLGFYRARDVQVIVLSEYGICDVSRPVHLNRHLREKGWLRVRDELGRELLDPGASRAFAVADHQVAHVYVRDRSDVPAVRALLESIDCVAEVLGSDEKGRAGIDHTRAGDLIAVAAPSAWFTYYYWLDDSRAPDFARCVDIHRKPGYDPVELFTDAPYSSLGLKARMAWRLLQKGLGFRMLMDIVPLDAALVRGSHGARPVDPLDWPILLAPMGRAGPSEVDSPGVHGLLRGWIESGLE